MNQLEEIKGRAEEARPGPWEVIEDEGTVRTRDGEIMFDRSAESGSYWNAHGRRNAEFIAHARTDVPKLLAALEAVEAHHQPIPAGAYDGSKIQICATCSDDTGNWEIYPCPTLTGITEALQ